MDAESPTPNRPVVSGDMSPPDSKFPRLSKKALLWVAVIVGLLLLLGIAWMVMTNRNNAAETAAKQTMGPAANIDTAGINPATIKIKKGQEVTWINKDTREHRLTADAVSLSGFDTVESLASGDSYTFTFDSAGTFHYYDPDDPRTFVGTVIVE